MTDDDRRPADQPLTVEIDGPLATVTLNRPDRNNALNMALKVALRDALSVIATDASIRAVLLTGGGRNFCVGQDLAEHAALAASGAVGDTVREHYNPITTALATMPKPVVGAIGGACVGAGLGFALACDVRVISSTATFGTAFSGVGLTFDSGASAALTRSVGAARTLELILTGATFSATDAVAWGIAGTIVAPAEVLSTATALATRLAHGPTAAFAASKRLVARSSGLVETLEAEAEAQNQLFDTADHRAAVTAFLAKERATFIGR